MKSSNEAHMCFLLFALAIAGCGPMDVTVNKKTSYADLVVTYNAEVETLDKLEAKRKELIAEHTRVAQQRAIREAVESVGSGSQGNISSDPNEALDQAVAAAELQSQLQKGLLNSLEQPSQSHDATSTAEKEFPAELKAQLAEVDAEIAKQKQRVERARAARDAAESK